MGEIAGGILAYTKKDEVTQHMVKALDHIVSTNYVTDKPSEAQKAAVKSLDWFQKELKCCGTTGPSSWANSTWYKSHNKTLEQVPESCCQSTPCERTYEPASSSIFHQGCIVQGTAFFKDNMYKLGGGAIGVAVVQLMGIVFAICLIKAIREDVPV